MWQFPYDEYVNDVTYYIGSSDCSKNTARYFLLYRNRKVLVVQLKAPLRIPPSDPEHSRKSRDRYVLQLEKIHAMVDSLSFDQNWAYFVEQDDGSSRVIYKNKHISPPLYPIWLPLIEEKDIIVTKWAGMETCEALWKGQEVDILLAFDEHWQQSVGLESEGHRIIHEAGLSHLTFRALGHLARDGRARGLMVEAAHGRAICYSDRAAVYKAITALQSKGILHVDLSFDNMMMTDQGFRLLNLTPIRAFSPDKMDLLEKKARVQHWERLEMIFNSLQIRHCFCVRSRIFPTSATIMPSMPAPNRPLTPYDNFLLTTFSLVSKNQMTTDEWFYLLPWPESYRNYRVKRTNRRITAPVPEEDSPASLHALERRHKARQSQSYIVSIRVHHASHPYIRKPGTHALLLAPEIPPS